MLQPGFDDRKVRIQTYTDRKGNPIAEKIIIRKDCYEYNEGPAQVKRTPLLQTYEEVGAPERPRQQRPAITNADNSLSLQQAAKLRAAGVKPAERRYISPPQNEAGMTVNLCDRPLLCLSTSDELNEVLVGSSNHSAYAVDLSHSNRRGKVREMYSKKSGHTEWVTGVVHLSDHRAVSVGMDSKVCLWSSDRARCLMEYDGIHFGSISRLAVSKHPECEGPASALAFTAGYDGTVKCLSFGASSTGSGRRTVAAAPSASPVVTTLCTGGGAATPILDMYVVAADASSSSVQTVVAGSRDGGIFFWNGEDIGIAGDVDPIRKMRGHSGPVNILTPVYRNGDMSVPFMASGGADGYVKVWDARAPRACVMTLPAHRSSSGTAASVTNITVHNGMGGDLPLLVSGGADGHIVVTDLRRADDSQSREESGSVLYQWGYHKNGVYSMCSPCSGTVFSGDGAGMLHCYDISSTAAKPGLQYGLGVCAVGAIQKIEVLHRSHQIVCAGDDGSVSVYEY